MSQQRNKSLSTMKIHGYMVSQKEKKIQFSRSQVCDLTLREFKLTVMKEFDKL